MPRDNTDRWFAILDGKILDTDIDRKVLTTRVKKQHKQTPYTIYSSDSIALLSQKKMLGHLRSMNDTQLTGDERQSEILILILGFALIAISLIFISINQELKKENQKLKQKLLKTKSLRGAHK